MSKISNLMSSESTEWYTPSRYIEAARRVLGEIDVDPASSEYANRTVRAKRCFTKEDDGLLQEWRGRVFLNPPYGGQAKHFVSKLVKEHKAGRTTEAIALLNANAVETRWFAPMWEHTLCFPDHRVHFDAPPERGLTKSSANHASVFVYLGERVNAFIDEFGEFGPIVQRIRRQRGDF